MANVSGGLKTGPAYIGRVQAVANFDPEPLTGWKGALFQVSTYQIHGVGLTGAFIGSYAAVSDIEALATTRLNEVWVEQKLNDWLSLRIGQLAVDSEFFLSPYLGIGIGGTFGWPPIATANLPGGGVVYPFATPAARLKITPSDERRSARRRVQRRSGRARGRRSAEAQPIRAQFPHHGRAFRHRRGANQIWRGHGLPAL